jgi:hypothetical protein
LRAFFGLVGDARAGGLSHAPGTFDLLLSWRFGAFLKKAGLDFESSQEAEDPSLSKTSRPLSLRAAPSCSSFHGVRGAFTKGGRLRRFLYWRQ